MKKTVTPPPFLYTSTGDLPPLNQYQGLESTMQVDEIIVNIYMWHDQEEWVGCREYWFWVTALKRCQILMFFIVFKFQRMIISLQPDVRLRWGLDQNVAFSMDKWLILKTQNWILPTCDSFPLIVSHICTGKLAHIKWESEKFRTCQGLNHRPLIAYNVLLYVTCYSKRYLSCSHLCLIYNY